MRRTSGFAALLVLVAACGGDTNSTAVIPDSIEVSPDRRRVTVVAYYPLNIVCAHEPGGVDIEIERDVAVVTAILAKDPDVEHCLMVCDQVTQTLTLAEPLPDDVRFEAPPGADPGCAAVGEGTAPSTTTLDPALP